MPAPSSHLMTDWICIATAGETVDGREIPENWLTEMAETYDPELYTALIWPNHERYYGNSGEVLALRTGKEDGITKLYARLCPSVDLVYTNRRGQLLFSSIEPEPDFRGTGKCYLEGLAVTDSPASVGTTRIRFSADKEKNKSVYGAPVPLVINMVTERPGDKDMSGEKNWRNLFGLNVPEPEPTPEPTPEPAPGNVNKFSDEAIGKLAEAVAALENQFSQMSADVEVAKNLANEVSGIKSQFSDIKKLLESEDAKQLFSSLPDLLPKFKKLDETFSKLPTANPGEKENSAAAMIV